MAMERRDGGEEKEMKKKKKITVPVVDD